MAIVRLFHLATGTLSWITYKTMHAFPRITILVTIEAIRQCFTSDTVTIGKSLHEWTKSIIHRK